MNKVIITPMYYIDKDLYNLLELYTTSEDTVTLIVTDDVSPIFPLDRRLEWLNSVFVGNKFTVDSMIYNDEYEEFKEVLNKKLYSIFGDTVYDATVFLTENAEWDYEDDTITAITLTSPLDIDLEEDTPVRFATRCGNEFNRYLEQKGTLPLTEEMYVVPVIKGVGSNGEETRYYGVVTNYDDEAKLEPMSVFIDYMPTLAHRTVVINKWLEMFFIATPISHKLLGNINGVSVYAAYATISEDSPLSLENGENRMLIADNLDVVYIKEDFFKLATPEFSWIYTALIESEKQNEAIDAEE